VGIYYLLLHLSVTKDGIQYISLFLTLYVSKENLNAIFKKRLNIESVPKPNGIIKAIVIVSNLPFVWKRRFPLYPKYEISVLDISSSDKVIKALESFGYNVLEDEKAENPATSGFDSHEKSGNQEISFSKEGIIPESFEISNVAFSFELFLISGLESLAFLIVLIVSINLNKVDSVDIGLDLFFCLFFLCIALIGFSSSSLRFCFADGQIQVKSTPKFMGFSFNMNEVFSYSFKRQRYNMTDANYLLGFFDKNQVSLFSSRGLKSISGMIITGLDYCYNPRLQKFFDYYGIKKI
jgi:hypothetical protein